MKLKLSRAAYVRCAVTAIAALAAAGCGVKASGSPPSTSSALRAKAAQAAQVKAVFIEAETTYYSLGSPPQSYIRAMTSPGWARRPQVVAASVRAELLDSGKKALARYFTPSLVQRDLTALDNAVHQDANPNVMNLGVGVTNVKFIRVKVTGAIATAEAHVTVRGVTRIRQTNTGPWLTTPGMNIVDDILTLVREPSGRWLVNSYYSNLVPGYGP